MLSAPQFCFVFLFSSICEYTARHIRTFREGKQMLLCNIWFIARRPLSRRQFCVWLWTIQVVKNLTGTRAWQPKCERTIFNKMRRTFLLFMTFCLTHKCILHSLQFRFNVFCMGLSNGRIV